MRHFLTFCFAVVLLLAFGQQRAVGQRVRFPSPPPPATTAPAAPSSTTPPPPSAFGQPSFDPYGGEAGGATSSFSMGDWFSGSAAPSPSDLNAQPGGEFGGPYPSANPPVLLPGGSWQPGAGGPTVFAESLKLIQNTRLVYTWLAGDDQESGDELDINDIEAGVTFAFPNFLFSGQPIYISPVYVQHLWDGPVSSLVPPATPFAPELPGQAYSAYLEFAYRTNPARQLGALANVRVGAFSDFETFNEDSLRIMGRGLLTLRVSPRLMLKGGVEYFDRLDVKLLPAGGVLWTPNPNTRFDIYFPQPKLSQYLVTLGNTEFWWYVGGEYGGGSWTIERTSGNTEQIDINDIRVMLGVEWGAPRLIRQGVQRGFFEVGFVFDREVIYDERPQDNFEPSETVMLRGGFYF